MESNKKGYKLIKRAFPIVLASATAVTGYFCGFNNGNVNGCRSGQEAGYQLGYETGYILGSEKTKNQILSEMNDELKDIQNLKEYLTSDIISLLKAKAELADVEVYEKEANIPLSEIYVLDTQNEGIITYGEASTYSYRYIFIRSKQVPKVGGHGILEYWPGQYEILFGSDDIAAEVVASDRWTHPGSFYIENSGNDNEVLKYIEPLIYYLPEEYIKDFYIKEELESIFYKLNSNSIYRRVKTNDN